MWADNSHCPQSDGLSRRLSSNYPLTDLTYWQQTQALSLSALRLPVFTNQSKLAAVWPLFSESLQITLPVCDGKSLDNGTISAWRKEGNDVTRQALIGKGRPAWDMKKMSVRSLEENHISMNRSLVHLCQEDPQGIVFPYGGFEQKLRWNWDRSPHHISYNFLRQRLVNFSFVRQEVK